MRKAPTPRGVYGEDGYGGRLDRPRRYRVIDHEGSAGCGKDTAHGMGSWWEERSLTQKILLGICFGILGLAFFSLLGWVVMRLWNWLMPELFGLKRLSYWQAWGSLRPLLDPFQGHGLLGFGPHKRPEAEKGTAPLHERRSLRRRKNSGGIEVGRRRSAGIRDGSLIPSVSRNVVTVLFFLVRRPNHCTVARDRSLFPS